MHSQSYLLVFLAIAAVGIPASLPSVATAQVPTETAMNPGATSEVEAPTLDRPTVAVDGAERLNISLYRADLFCETLVPETATVSRDRPTDEAIGQLLQDWGQGAFRISGYRTRRDDRTQTVTIDLRLSPDAPRQWISLSTCEQFALLGGLRTTLLENPELETQNVVFTSRGEPLQF